MGQAERVGFYFGLLAALLAAGSAMVLVVPADELPKPLQPMTTYVVYGGFGAMALGIILCGALLLYEMRAVRFGRRGQRFPRLYVVRPIPDRPVIAVSYDIYQGRDGGRIDVTNGGNDTHLTATADLLFSSHGGYPGFKSVVLPWVASHTDRVIIPRGGTRVLRLFSHEFRVVPVPGAPEAFSEFCVREFGGEEPIWIASRDSLLGGDPIGAVVRITLVGHSAPFGPLVTYWQFGDKDRYGITCTQIDESTMMSLTLDHHEKIIQESEQRRKDLATSARAT